jgi:hypothetical protein
MTSVTIERGPQMRRLPVPIASVALIVLLGACSAAPQGSAAVPTPTPGASSSGIPSASETPFPAALQSGQPYAIAIDPAAFVASVDNPYFPLAPGTRWVMEGEGGSAGETTITEVTTDTRTILGVECTVVRDEVDVGDELRELTFDWYAQDASGNVWYFGEDTAEYKNGKVTTREGAWEAGVDGAQPGIIMPAQPVVGLTYRQEFLEGEAEDLAKVVELAARAATPAGSYANALVTEDWTPLEPDVTERKFYAPGVGLVMERVISGGHGINRLVEVTLPE